MDNTVFFADRRGFFSFIDFYELLGIISTILLPNPYRGRNTRGYRKSNEGTGSAVRRAEGNGKKGRRKSEDFSWWYKAVSQRVALGEDDRWF